MAKGDWIQVGIRISGEEAMTKEVGAVQNGRRVEHAFETDGKINWLVVKQITRGGTTVTELRVPTSEVLWMDVRIKDV